MTGSVNDGDDLNRRFLPEVAYDVGIEVPETITAAHQLFMIVPDSWRSPQSLKAFVYLKAETFRSAWIVRGNVGKNLTEVGDGLRR
jgi:hypothetical protein